MAQCSVMGVITQVSNVESGVRPKTGKQWSRQQILVKKIDNSQYEKFVQFDVWDNNIAKINAQVGMVGEFFFDAESRWSQNDQTREGRWFTSLTCYNCKQFQTQGVPAQDPQAAHGYAPQGYAPQQGFAQPQVQPQGGGWNPQNGGDWNQNGGFGR